MGATAQLIPIEVHYHHGWLIWVLFLVGEALHVAVQVDDIARKNKLKRPSVFEQIGIRFAYRAFACAMIFLAIWQYPEFIAAIVRIFHPLGQDEAAVLAIPMNNALAGLYGLALDAALNYIPGLNSRLPNTDIPVQQSLEAAAKENVAAGAAISDAQVKAAETSLPPSQK